MEHVILVDEQDNERGTMEKMEAHQQGVLHRAFSVLLFNSQGQLMLQKRARTKYHSGGLWTNTCCSHPLPGEPVERAVQRKLMQEMGIQYKPEFAFKFIYKTKLEGGLTEYELDHVYTGLYDGTPVLNQEEAEGWKLMDLPVLRDDIQRNPTHYTVWFKIIMNHPQLSSIQV